MRKIYIVLNLIPIFFITTTFADSNIGIQLNFNSKISIEKKKNIYTFLNSDPLVENSETDIVVVPTNLKNLSDTKSINALCSKVRMNYPEVINCGVIQADGYCCYKKLIVLPSTDGLKEIEKLIKLTLKSESLTELIERDPGVKCKKVKIKINSKEETANGIKFKLGKVLKPGKCFYLEVPESLQELPVEMVSLAHMQEPKYNTGGSSSEEGSSDYDKIPGFTSIQLHSTNLDDEKSWRYWGGSSSSRYGSKFAEVGYSPEIDNLYNWPDKGHYGVKNGDFTKKLIKTNAIKIMSTGDDPVTIDSIDIKFIPEKSKKEIIHIFTKNLSFGNSTTGTGKSFGVKRKGYGKYPGALALGRRTDYEAPDLPKGIDHSSRSTLLIPINSTDKINSIEVAIGDQHNDVETTNSDGGSGSKGYAKFYIGIKRKDGTKIWFLKNQGVPPQGFFRVQPPKGFIQKEGDKIILNSRSDTTMLMGFKLGLN
jgi:hypothetical protein